LEYLFPTPIKLIDLRLPTSLLSKACEAIDKSESVSVPQGSLYPYGYTTYFSDRVEEFQQDIKPFEAIFRKEARKYIEELLDTPIRFEIKSTGIFGNINNKYSHHEYHYHRGSHIAGCLYLKIPEDALNSSKFRAHNPAESSLMAMPEALIQNTKCFSTSYEVTPLEGYLLLFPAHMPHHLPTHLSEGSRYSLVCNMTVDTYE